MLTNNDSNDASNNILYLEGTVNEGRLPKKVLAHRG